MKKVLICDDEPYILESVSYIVRHAGHQVLAAADGETALALARSEKPDLMFLDIMLPGMSGFDVCRQLRQDSRTRHLHIIILSARGQDIDAVMGTEAGADEYITKPFSPRKLRRRLEEILDGR